MKSKFWENVNVIFNYFYRYITFLTSFLKSRLCISAKILFFVLNDLYRSWNVYFFNIWMIFVLFNSVKHRIGMSELALLVAKVSSIFKVFHKFTNSSLLLTVLLLLFKIMDSLWKAFSEKKGPTVFQTFLLSETTLWPSFTKKTSFSFAEQTNRNLFGD